MNSSTENWQQEAIEQAREELKRRNIPKEYIKNFLDRLAEEKRKYELDYKEQLLKNETKNYSMADMAYIFLMSPFILAGKWSVDLSLIQLRKENYKRKFKQRLLLLFGGVMFWALVIISLAKHDAKKKRQEIERKVIEWEKNNPKDTL